MTEEKVNYNVGQPHQAVNLDPRHFLVTMARNGKAVDGPIYINATDRYDAARIAYDELPGVKDSDTLLVWTLVEFDQNEKPGEYAAGNVRFNLPVRPDPVEADQPAVGDQLTGEEL